MVNTVESVKRAAPVEAPEKLPSMTPDRQGASLKRWHMFARLGIIFFLLLIAGAIWWLWASGREETDDAYIDGHISNISSRVAGTISQVLVSDNQIVKSGQVLLELDPNDYQVQVDQSKAALEEARHKAAAARTKIAQSTLSSLGQKVQAKGDYSSVEAQIRAAKFALTACAAETQQQQSKIDELTAQVKFALSDLERYRKTYEERVVTKQQFDKAKNAYDVAVAQLEEAKQGLSMAQRKEVQYSEQIRDAEGRLKKSEGGMTSALASVHQSAIDDEEFRGDLAKIKKAEADLHQDELQLSYTRIIAPVAGRIGRKSAEVGQHVESGQSLMSIVQDNPWITANFKETQIGRMHRGQTALVKIDTFSEKIFRGAIDSIAPASGAKFSLLPPDNATGNFTKVVQRVPVKIVFDERTIESIKSVMAPGMSCTVTVFVRDK
jgi:membrane fusion protein, multidrug efflux system